MNEAKSTGHHVVTISSPLPSPLDPGVKPIEPRWSTQPLEHTSSSRFCAFLLFALVGLTLLSGCSRDTNATATADAATASPSPQASASSVASAAASSPPSAPSPFGLVLPEKLATEAAGRPTGTPKAEDVLAAITKSGVPLQDEAQHLASTIGAHFCIGAKSTLGLAMSACEYNDEAAALAGRDMSAKAFARVEHRDITVNKKTTLTILQAPFSPQSQDAHDKAVAAFKKL
jgi:hypothetical protein